jgi:hypothetical protein
MVLRLLGGSLLAAIAASVLVGDRLPIRLWVVGCVVVGVARVAREARQQRSTAALARGAGRHLSRLEAEEAMADDTELVTFESLQQAADMVGLAAMVNDQWVRDDELATEIADLQSQIDGFRTTDDAVADLAEAWRIEGRCEECARIAVQLHRRGTV